MTASMPRAAVGLGTAAVAVGLCAAGCVLLARNVAAGAPAGDGPGFWPMLVAGAITYAVTGGLLVVRRIAGLLGPQFLGVALCLATAMFAREYGVHGLQVAGRLPGDRWLFWTHTWVWVPGLLSVLLVTPLLLPDGALPSRRRRAAVAAAMVAITLATLGWATTPYDQLDDPVVDPGVGPHPLVVPATLGSLIDVLSSPLVLLPSAGLAVAALVRRWRRTDADHRQAMAWVFYGVALSLVCEVLAIVWTTVAFAAAAVMALPLCCLIAVTRHRLWDLQLVIRHSLVYGGLTALVAAAYAGVVGLVGGAVGASTGAPIVATAVVAVLVLPLHQLLRSAVNRLVHGQSEDPLVTTSVLGQRLGAAVTPDELTSVVLPETLAGVARALRLRHIGLATADGRTYAHGPVVPDLIELPLHHSGMDVGTLRLAPARGGLTHAERRAVDGIAAHAAVAVHGVLLFGELQRERERVVVARAEERRRLRHELHDGVGTALAAACLQVESARDLMTDHPADALAQLERLDAQLRDVVHDVRAVTRDLRPSLVDELGLAGALRELGARAGCARRPVEVDVGTLGEVPAAVEVAAYLVAAELVTNACRHSGGSRVRLTAHHLAAELLVRVADDGCGIGPGAVAGVGLGSVRRRVEELGGRLVRGDGPGTVVEVRLPVGTP